MQENTILELYSRLLADLTYITKRPLLEAHWNVSEEWVLKEAPKLDKLMWAILEKQFDPAISIFSIRDMALERGCIVSTTPDVHPNLLLRRGLTTERAIAGYEALVFPKAYSARSRPRKHRFIASKDAVKTQVLSSESLFTIFWSWMEDTLALLLTGVDVTRDLEAAHQMLVFCYKAEHEPTKKQLEETYELFIQNDEQVAVWDEYFKGTGLRHPICNVARSHVGKVIYQAKWLEIAPSHGPGVVYPRKMPWEKSGNLTYYPGLDDVYPYSDWVVGLPNYWKDNLVDANMQSKFEIECRIQAVPKDSRGPRIICVHPSEAIWIQQGTRHVLEHAISSSPLTRGKINFHDQTVNGDMALKASLSKEYCTLDLKDASDRLSNELVRFLFGDYAYRFLGCSRAVQVRIGERVLKLRKFAPMGNALTFPVQSVCFWAMVRAGISLHYGENCDDVYVFGDDIVFPSKYHRGVIRALVHFGLIPNADKTYVHGSFRESCGVDAWQGIDITPLRLKVGTMVSVSDALATCDLAKRARLKGYSRVASFLYRLVERKFGKLCKSNNPVSQGLVEFEDIEFGKLLTYEPKVRYNKYLHRWETPTRLVTQVCKILGTHEWFHVQDSLLSLWRKYDKGIYQPLLLNTPTDPKGPVGHWGAVVDYSERGYEYPIPHRLRLSCGWTPLIERCETVKSSVVSYMLR